MGFQNIRLTGAKNYDFAVHFRELRRKKTVMKYTLTPGIKYCNPLHFFRHP